MSDSLPGFPPGYNRRVNPGQYLEQSLSAEYLPRPVLHAWSSPPVMIPRIEASWAVIWIIFRQNSMATVIILSIIGLGIVTQI